MKILNNITALCLLTFIVALAVIGYQNRIKFAKECKKPLQQIDYVTLNKIDVTIKELEKSRVIINKL